MIYLTFLRPSDLRTLPHLFISPSESSHTNGCGEEKQAAKLGHALTMQHLSGCVCLCVCTCAYGGAGSCLPASVIGWERAGGGICPSVTVNTKAPCAVTAPERARAVAVPRKLSRRLIDRVSHPVAGSKMAGLSTCVTPPSSCEEAPLMIRPGLVLQTARTRSIAPQSQPPAGD